MKEQNSPFVRSEKLKVSFIRLHPHKDIEGKLLAKIKDNFKSEDGKFAAFKALGHYDLIVIYPTELERLMLRGGTIGGIRSFSTMDCFIWSPNNSNDLLSIISAYPLLSISNATMKRTFLRDNGGIYNSNISSLSEAHNFHYLNSTCWGEQIILIGSDSMEGLWNKSRTVFEKLKEYCIDLHSVISLNIGFVQDIDVDPIQWTENISLKDSAYAVICNIRFVLGNNKFIPIGRLFEANGLLPITKLSSFDINEAQFLIENGTWGKLISCIRYIRSTYSRHIASTKISVVRKETITNRSIIYWTFA